MKQFSTEAIILRRTNYGEADRILSLLTPNHGKQSVIAKGVRRPKSKLAGGLELFAVCKLTILQGRGDMGVVTSSRIKEFYGDILHDYDRMQVAYEVIKQINKATETVTDQAFYELLADSLKYLNDLRIDWRLIELWFGIHIRALLGDDLNLLTDIEGQPLKADKLYSYNSDEKAFFYSLGGNFDSNHLKLLRLATYKSPKALNNIGGLELLNWQALRMLVAA